MSTQQQMKSIDRALSIASQSIPVWFNPLFSILKITSSLMDSLGSVEDHALHASLTQMFSDQLDKLKETNVAFWRSDLEIEWCNAKLRLYALTFTVSANATSLRASQIHIHRQVILHKAFEAASSLTTELRKLSQQCTSDLYPSGLLTFVPKSYFSALFNAAAFLFRFIATSSMRTRTSTQEILAMNSIIEAHKIFHSFPEQRELTRAAIHIEMFIDVLKNGPAIGMDELVVSNKLGASVMFDAVFRACRQRNTDPKTGKPLAVREWKTVNETFAQRLPDVPIQSTKDTAERIIGVTDYENNAEAAEASSALGGQNPQWWGNWENYIDLFQAGAGQWDAMDVGNLAGDHDNLGDLGSFMYA
ncbi:MAG: hypothetical protein M1820_007872 [Bogoriella megaspora]|nr:MAG: hypothetical protein M1820_007872 [Bogoriella megaspora]